MEFFKNNSRNKELLKMRLDRSDSPQAEVAHFMSDPVSHIAWFKEENRDTAHYGPTVEDREVVVYINEMMDLVRTSAGDSPEQPEFTAIRESQPWSEDDARARVQIYKKVGASKEAVLAWLADEQSRWGGLLSEEGKQYYEAIRRSAEEVYGDE